MDEKGFIKIHRKIMEWGWYADLATKAVFIHLLLAASYSSREYRGHTLETGQCAATLSSIAGANGISVQQTRTALEHLTRTGEITIEPTNKFSVFTINHYTDYQLSEKRPAPPRKQETAQDKPEKPAEEKQSSLYHPDFSAVVAAYEGNIGSISRSAADEINTQLQTFPADLIIAAIGEAAIQNKRSWSYVRGILRTCKNNNIKTVAAFKSEQQSRQPAPPAPTKSATNAEIIKMLGG